VLTMDNVMIMLPLYQCNIIEKSTVHNFIFSLSVSFFLLLSSIVIVHWCVTRWWLCINWRIIFSRFFAVYLSVFVFFLR
jgi:hypothetical protein